VRVEGLDGVSQVAAGDGHACACRNDGSVVCWGDNSQGQLGDGTTNDSSSPVPVEGLPASDLLAAGDMFACAVSRDEEVWCWGMNSAGQVGSGSTEWSVPVPERVVGLEHVKALETGERHACAVTSDARVWCWGAGGFGQLGDSGSSDSSVPVMAAIEGQVIAVDPGFDHTCALLLDGSVWCWGYNVLGELGNGTTTNSSIPVPVGL
jgi:alpha-tubulin suppressor-like RCC1 family protein